MAVTPRTDAELARLCRQGDRAAWRQLVRQCSPVVYRLALRMLGSEADAEDAAQEVFMKIHRSFESFDPTRPLGPWVSRITYTTCLQRLRGTAAAASARSVTLEPETLERLPDTTEPGPEEDTGDREAGELLVTAMERLSAQDRALLVMRYREGLSDAEVGEATGMPVNTVKTRLARARQQLKRRLAPTLGGDRS